MKHFPRHGTGDRLEAICDRYTATDLGGIEDERRDRFTTDESVIFNVETGCSFCREKLIEASRHDVIPQVWQHADVVAREMRGELDDGPRPWPTWRGAVRSYVAWQDNGASLRSSSDPGRFEAIPSGFTGIPGGDQGQRQAERLAWVGQAMSTALVGGFITTTFPQVLRLLPLECLQILVTVVCGRDVDARTGGSGRWTKQRIRVRLPITDDPDVPPEKRRSAHAIIAAEVSERTGIEVTAGHVGAIEREGGRTIQAALQARGLVLHADTSIEEREAVVAEKITPWDLEGWDEIATALDVDVSTAKRYEKEHRLPIDRYGGGVRAESAKLRAWLPGFLASTANKGAA